MDLSQCDSLVLTSGSSIARNIDNHKRRHLCFCGEELIAMSSSSVSSHDRRYVACGRMPKCSFFEWIDDKEEWKNGLAKLRGSRVRCFCGEVLTVKTSGTTRNPNRRFISCPNRRCKFFEWIEGEDGTRTTIRKQSSIAGDAGIIGTQHDSSEFEAQERKMERISVDMEKLKVEILQVENVWGDCVQS
ncbi:hypothetical protein PIB30_036742 [Stylosanthes scabra]|uniref:GRF-type domain-containing protein n=1 Tax=Stylosanthes scabra TaxID=79078 RepID=A0ABU6SEB9_9FABA|nr:hypothetical protein [Stylosanthes scabra]